MSSMQCPVCTLYLREGMSMKDHLDTHTKDRVIDALVSSEKKVSNISNQTNQFSNFVQTQYQIANPMLHPMQQFVQQAPTMSSYMTDSSEKTISVFNAPFNYSPQTIISHPGTIIKIPPRPQSTKIIAVPLSNQFMGPPHYNPALMQMSLRATVPNSILSNPTSNLNTQQVPTIVNGYPQISSTIQSVQSSQQFAHSFSNDTSIIQQTQQISVPTSTISLNTFHPTSTFNNNIQIPSPSVQSNEIVTPTSVPKETLITDLANSGETCNAETQISDIESTNSTPELPGTCESAQYENSEEIKEESCNNGETEDAFDYFEDTFPESNSEEMDLNFQDANKEKDTVLEGDDEEIDFTHQDMNKEKDTLSEDSNEKIDFNFQDMDKEKGECDNLTNVEHSNEEDCNETLRNKFLDSSISTEKNESMDHSLDESYKKEEETFLQGEFEVSSSYIVSNTVVTPSTCDTVNESTITSGNVIKCDDEPLHSSVDDDNDDDMYNGEDGVCLESPIKREEKSITFMVIESEDQQKQIRSNLECTSNTSKRPNQEVISSNDFELNDSYFSKSVNFKNGESYMHISPKCTKKRIVCDDEEYDRKRKVTDRHSDEPITKREKHIYHQQEVQPVVQTEENKGYSDKIERDIKFSNLPSYDNEGDMPYEIKEKKFQIVSFHKTLIDVYGLALPEIKLTLPEIRNFNKCETVMLTDEINFPDLCTEIKLEAYNEKSNNVSSNFYDKKNSLKSNHENLYIDFFQNQFASEQNTEASNVPANTYSTMSPSVTTVIQSSVKTEPPPPYIAKSGAHHSTSSYSSNFYQASTSNDVLANNNHISHKASRTESLGNGNIKSEISLENKCLPTYSESHHGKYLNYTNQDLNAKLDRLHNLSHIDYDSDDAAPQWLFRGINILPSAMEDDRISCASPKTLLNLDHQTSFQTFVPEDSESMSLNMQTDEMMPPRGELSGQESLESSAWGYQEDNGSSNYRQWDEPDQDGDNGLINSNSFKIKIEKAEHLTKIEPIQLSSEKIKSEDIITPYPSVQDTKKRHVCIYCDETFVGWKARKYHMKVEHPQLFNDTETANKLIQKTQNPISSERSKPSSSTVSCTSCPMKFDSSISFASHFQQVHAPTIEQISVKSKQRECSTCHESFDKLKLFQDHIRYVHPLECPLCKKSFLTKPNLTLHMRTHLIIKPYKCDRCEKSFVTAQKLSDHKNTHTGNAPFPCSMCDRHFKRYSNLAQHKKVIHLKKKKTKDFYCHCGEIFQSKGKLLWHQETHASIPKQCTFCSEKFTHTSSLTRHIRKNHDPCYLPDDRRKDDENVSCKICKIVVLKSTLKSHMKIHASSKPFSCSVCKKSFYTKWNLGLHQWTHVSRTHMPFKCKLCNRGFYNSGEYQAHLRSHKNIRPYTCNYCGRKFIRKFNCIRHVREHEASKKYNCSVCGKTFHRSYYLTAHERVHNGERPFTCHICGKTSTTKSNHNKHVKTHHARENVNTEG